MSDLVIDAVAAANTLGRTKVRIELTDGRGDPITGYLIGSDETFVSASVFTTDANGQLIIDVTPNTDIQPGNSCYTVTVADKSFLIQKSGASQNLFEALTVEPGPLDPISTEFLLKANNLSDVGDAATARDNLGLGNSATLDVGDTPGTVAAGDDPRFDTIVTDHGDLTGLTDPGAHPATAISTVPSGDLVGTDVQTNLTELNGFIDDVEAQAAADLAAHVMETVDAHDASAISVVPTGDLTSTDVQAGLEELQGEITTAIASATASLNAHLNDTTDAHDASAISVVPTGDLASSNVQAGLEELSTETTANAAGIQAHVVDTVDAHDASAISFIPFSTIGATNVQDAIEEVFAEASGGGGGGTSDHNALFNRDAANQHPATSVDYDAAGTLSGGTVQAGLEELDGDIQAHLADTVDAHDATAISFAPTGTFSSTTAQAAIVEGYTDATAYSDAALAGHTGDTVDAHDASAISSVPFGAITATDVQNALQDVYAAATTGLDEADEIIFAPTGDIVATNVQDAIVEVDGELHDHLTDTVDAHDASAISFVPTGTLAATDVQAALQEVNDEFVRSDGSYAAVGTDVMSTRVTGNANPRFTLNADGGMEWGAGTAVTDTTLFRSAANTLKTDSNFEFDNQAAIIGTTGRMSIAAGSTIPTDAMLRVGNSANIKRFASASQTYGVDTNPTNTSAGAVTGVYAHPQSSTSGGTVTSLIGMLARVEFANATGTLTDGTVLKADAPSITSGGTVATAVGVQIEGQKITGVTTGYGIRQVGTADLNSFAGVTSFGQGVTVTGTLTNTELQAATANIAAHLADTSDAHDASAISVVPTGNLSSTDVQAALQELQTDIDGGAFVVPDGSYAATTTDVLKTRVTGNANPRFVLNADGGLEWGDGTLATDTVLNRPAADVLGTPDTFRVGTTSSRVEISPSGFIGINANGVSAVALLNVGTTGTAAFSTASSVFGIGTSPVNSSTGSVTGVSAFPVSTAASSTIASMIGVNAAFRLASTTSTVTAGTGVRINGPTISAGGVVTTAAGIIIDSQKVTGVTNGVGINQNGTNDTNTFAGVTTFSQGVTVTGTLTNTELQAATSNIAAHLADTSDAHDASAISVVATGNLSSTDVQAALQEHQGDIDTINTAASTYVLNNGSYAAGGTDVLRTRVTSDANPRFTINTDGTLEWGDGTLAADVSLFRTAADVLMTADSFRITGTGAGSINLLASGRVLVGAADNVDRLVIIGGSTTTNDFATTNTVNGVRAMPSNSLTGSINGIVSVPTSNTSGGTVSALQGVNVQTNFNNSTGTLTSSTCFTANGPAITSGGTITTAIGLDIASQKPTGVTTGIGIRQQGSTDTNSFAGATTFSNTVAMSTTATITTGLTIGSAATSTTGELRLAQLGTIKWRNNANTLDNTTIGLSSGDQLQLNGGISVAIQNGTTNVLTTANADLNLTSGCDLVLATSGAGTKFGTGATQLLSFYGSTAIVQPSTTGVTGGFTANAGTAMNSASVSTGNNGTKAYTFGDIVAHLKSLGLIATS